MFVLVQSTSNGYVMFGKTCVFRVVTGSMEPEIPIGSLLVARKTDITDIQKDDIVCFRSKEQGMLGTVITHRVIGVYEMPDGQTALQTKGDANLSIDRYDVTTDNLIGCVIWHTGDGSKMAAVISFLTSQYGFLACIVLPVILIAIWIFRDTAKNMRKEIDAVKKQLEESEQESPHGNLSKEEYDAMYQRVADEVRKELKQDAEQVDPQDPSTDEPLGDVAEEPTPASTDETADA